MQPNKRYFNIEQANRMIPTLEQTFGRLLQIHAQIRETHTRLTNAGFEPPDDEFELSPPGASMEVRNDLASLRTLIDGLRDDVIEMAQAGCVVKSIDSGLVDWYAELDGRDILSCWKLGEKSVEFWHEVESGFTGRQPITALLPTPAGYSLS